ncbi:MAG: hypothetical protein KF855_06840 [Acidobacteria bacterium]|nr:hypothetical protein [Acidobacteriota bacterium]
MELIFTVKRDKQTVFEYLTQPYKFVSVHPLIYKMTDLGGGYYKVYEQVKFGSVPYKFTYKANIVSQQNDEVTINASVAGITKITMHFYLRSSEAGTAITEHISINSLLPIKRFMHNLFKEQHGQLFKNIEGKEEEIKE